ncbi:MAG: TolC family protein [Candidatus Loosdrechtia sp.]|uniref:TolC family protein n=1 Tax=Candidatus Loosdrechtia sp. TaxID=3101272 RepID=UPI003A691E34|nr:MAG: TolC family protein [Candidatus Jettenia sp. AMX2]
MRYICLLILFFFSGTAVIAREDIDTSRKPSDNKNTVDKTGEAPPLLGLSWLIREAMEHNPEIIAAQRRFGASKEVISQAKSLEDPMITVGTFNTNFPLNVGGQTDLYRRRYSVSQKIPFPGKLRLRGEVAAEESRMSEQELRAKIQEIIALVKSTFYEFYYIDRAIEITEENRELLSKFAKIAEIKYITGKTTQRDVLAAQVELSTLSNNLIVLNEQRESVIALINTLIDRPPESTIGSPGTFEKNTLDLTMTDLERLALKNRPELKRFDYAVRRNEAKVKLSKRDYYYTDFEPMVEYMQMVGMPNMWETAVTINIPWIWSKNRSRVREAKEELSAARSDYRFINNKTLFEVKDFLVKIRSTESTVNLYEKSIIPYARQSLESARIGYEADRVDFLTLIDSVRVLLDSTLLYYRALADFEQYLANLERAVGITSNL